MMMENEDGLTSEDNSNINALPQSMVTVEVIDKTSQKGLGKSRWTDICNSRVTFATEN